MSNSRDFIFGWSFPFFRVFGIDVRIHWFFLLYMAMQLMNAKPEDGGWQMELAVLGILFGSVLLHEFGHSLACRSVGGQADRILLWPFGGLAECSPPLNPWASLWTTLCGPAVNLLLMAGAYLVLRAHGPDMEMVRAAAEKYTLSESAILEIAKHPMSLNPLEADGVAKALYGDLGKWLGKVFFFNYVLFLFNMVCVCYPMDAGRVVQEVLWLFVGYARSMWWATHVSFAFALLMIGLGVWAFAVGATSLLAVMGVFFLMGGWRRRQELAALRDHYGSWAAIPEPRETAQVGGWLGRFFVKAGATAAPAAAAPAEAPAASGAHREEIDRILRKVSEFGLASLTEEEMATLKGASN